MGVVGKILNKFGYNKSARKFNAAKITRFNADWILGYRTAADEEIKNGQLRTIRERARDLVNNNDYAKKFIRMCKINIVGADGFILQSKIRKGNNTLDKKTNKEIENLYWDWTKAKNCSLNGILTFRQIQNLLIETVAKDGEAFIRLYAGKKYGKYGLQMQIIEADLVDEDYSIENDNTYVVMGVEFERATGKKVAYYIKKSYNINTERVRVDASEIIHLGLADRASRSRYVSWLVQSMLRIKNIDGYEEAAIINARATAVKLGFFVSKYTENYNSEDHETPINASLEPGQWEVLPEGWEPHQMDPKYPHEQHEPFIKQTLRGIASGLGVSYNTLANDLTGVNYSSIRQGVLEERENWKDLQNWFIESFLEPVYEKWVEMVLLKNLVKTNISLEDANKPVFIGRRWAWVDPFKDAKAMELLNSMGVKSMTKIAGEIGTDFEEEIEMIAEEKKLLNKIKLVEQE